MKFADQYKHFSLYVPWIQPLFKPTMILSPNTSKLRTKLSHSILVSFGSFCFQLRFKEKSTDILSLYDVQLLTNDAQEWSSTFLNLHLNWFYHISNWLWIINRFITMEESNEQVNSVPFIIFLRVRIHGILVVIFVFPMKIV